MKKFLCSCIFASSFIFCHAAVYFVSPGGSPLNPGTVSQPWPDLTVALKHKLLAAGDTIQLAAGAYNDNPVTAVNGAPGFPVTIRGAGPGETILSGKLSVLHAYYIVRDLGFDGMAGNATSPRSYLAMRGAGCHDVVVDNCEFRRVNGGVGCQDDASGKPSNCSILNSVFHHPTANGMVSLSGSGHWINNCVFQDNAGFDAIRVFGPNHRISGNKFYRIHTPANAGFTAASDTPASTGVGPWSFSVGDGLLFTKFDAVTAVSRSNPALSITGFVSGYRDGILSIDAFGWSSDGTAADWDIQLVAQAVNSNHADIIQTFASSTLERTINLVFSGNYVEDCSAQWGNLENDASNAVNGGWLLSDNIFNRSRITLNCYIPDVRIINNTFFNTAGYTVGIRAAYSALKGRANRMQLLHNVFIRMDGNSYGSGAYSFNAALQDCGGDYNIVTSLSDGSFARFTMDGGTHNINGGLAPQEVFVDANNNDFTQKSGIFQSNTGTLPDDVVVNYNLGDFQDGTMFVRDSGPNGLDAAPSPILRQVAGLMGYALENPAAAKSWLSVPYNPVLDFNSFTVAIWVCPTATPTEVAYLSGVFGNAGDRRWKLGLNPSMTVSLTKYADGIESAGTVTSTEKLAVDKWCLVVAQFDDAKNLLSIRLGTTSTLGEWKSVSNSTGLFTGGKPTLGIFKLPGSSGTFVGKIDTMTLWNRPLGDAEVNLLWNSGQGTQYPY